MRTSHIIKIKIKIYGQKFKSIIIKKKKKENKR